MLSFISTNPQGRGFNEIGRHLASKGYGPLHGWKQGKINKRIELLHPKTEKSLLKKALDNDLIKGDHPLGDRSNRGKRNRYRITKKGAKFLAKSEIMIFTEGAVLNEVKMSSELFKEPFLRHEQGLDYAALMHSKIDPYMSLGAEKKFFVDGNIEAFSQQLRFGSKITLWGQRGSLPRPLTIEQIEQLSALMVAYAGGEREFYVVLNYKPQDADFLKNPMLREANIQLEFSYFHKWLFEFKNVNIDPERLELILNVALELILNPSKQSCNPEGINSEEIERYKKLWLEYDVKRKKAEKLMLKVRKRHFDSPEDP